MSAIENKYQRSHNFFMTNASFLSTCIAVKGSSSANFDFWIIIEISDKLERKKSHMKLYTKTGDKGRTSVIGNRLSKDDARIEAIGTLDEANSFIGKAVSELDDELFTDLKRDLVKVQHEIFDCGSELSNTTKEKPQQLSEEMITYLEKKIDDWTGEAPALEKFILPGGSQAAATLHIARTVTRRAERRIVTLMNQEETISAIPLQYINRLSDFLFAAARMVNYRLQVRDVEYERSAKVFRFKQKD